MTSVKFALSGWRVIRQSDRSECSKKVKFRDSERFRLPLFPAMPES